MPALAHGGLFDITLEEPETGISHAAAGRSTMVAFTQFGLKKAEPEHAPNRAAEHKAENMPVSLWAAL